MSKQITMLAVSMLILGGCASEPSIDTGPDAKMTFDGLAPINNSRFREAWADPDVDLKQYNKMIIGGAEFEFRAVKKSTGSTSVRRNSNNEFWMDDKTRAKLVETVTAVFAEELTSVKGFTVTEEKGADTLILIGGLHDIVSRVPPDLVGRGEIYLSSLGEATLVIEARDSLSGETIFRAVDRRAAERMGDMINVNSATTMSEVKRWARRWAMRLREGLESIHE
jgi:hypothetical protein